MRIEGQLRDRTTRPCILRIDGVRGSGRGVGMVGRVRRDCAMVNVRLPSDDEPLYLGGALVNLRDARVAIVPLGRHLGYVPHSTENLRTHRNSTRRPHTLLTRKCDATV
eukprot:3847744-Pleurochrysis_carterae.AAC.2